MWKLPQQTDTDRYENNMIRKINIIFHIKMCFQKIFNFVIVTLFKNCERYTFYGPHPKDGEDNVFTGACPFTGRYPSPRFFPRSLVPGPLLVCYPNPRFFLRSFPRGTPILPGGDSPIPGVIPVPGWGSTQPIWGGTPGQGYPPAGTGVPPGWELGSPHQDRTGVAPGQDKGIPPPPERTAERVLATRQAVCLLRPRRTFLIYFGFVAFRDVRSLCTHVEM